MLVPLGAHRDLVSSRGFSDDQVAHALGLSEWVDPEDREFDTAAVRARLRELHRRAERGDASVPQILQDNVARLAALVGMSDSECRILEFATMLHHERVLDDAADMLGNPSGSRIVDVLSVLLDLAPQEVRSALSTQGVLARSGLLSIDRSCCRTSLPTCSSIRTRIQSRCCATWWRRVARRACRWPTSPTSTMRSRSCGPIWHKR
jgi:hypothetical protein